MNLVLPLSISPHPGLYDLDRSPILHGILRAMDDPATQDIVVQKAAQIGYTTLLFAFLGRRILISPCPIIMLFSSQDAARDFVQEKFDPIVQETPALAQAFGRMGRGYVPPGSHTLFRQFPGGFIKFVGARAIRNVKSTSAAIVIAEEPDDAAANLNNQGDSVQLLWQRTKRMPNSKRILGGTPSVHGISRVEAHLEASDNCVLPIRCHACGHRAPLVFENVQWGQDENVSHPIFGTALPDTARYVCPKCRTAWDEDQRRENVRATIRDALCANDPLCGWTPTRPFSGIRGFSGLNDLYSCLPGAGTESIVRAHLTAIHKQKQGDRNAIIVFTNSVLGLPYCAPNTASNAAILEKISVDEQALAARPGLAYPELTLPEGALEITAGIDVQHDRLAIIIRAWGVGMESWLIYWNEIHASPSVLDPLDRSWNALEALLFQEFLSVAGWRARLSAFTIDTGDGKSAAIVYAWIRSICERYPGILIMAGKGSSSHQNPEIYSPPKAIDYSVEARPKAQKFGLRIYSIGTSRAKDWISGHIMLDGTGPGRWHWYEGVRSDYIRQVLSEVKLPDPRSRRMTWQLRPGHANEALDGEVYALHAAHALRLHTYTPAHWLRVAQRRAQLPLALDEPAPTSPSMADILRSLNG